MLGLANVWSIVKSIRYWVPALVSLAAIAAMLFLTVGNNESDNTIRVSLAERSQLPLVQEVNDDNNNYYREDSLRLAIAGVLSASRTIDAYQHLLSFMGKSLDRSVQLILKPTYAEINDLITGGRADVGFVCSRAYVEGHRDSGMELLVAPQMYGTTVYYSYLIVPSDSSATSLDDLRGSKFAFADPLSNSGHLVPIYQLYLMGESPATFFSRYFFTFSHDNSVRAVAGSLVDGAAVDSLVYDQMVANETELGARTKIIAQWGPYGIPPVVVSPGLDPDLKEQLLDFFLHIHESSEGREILGELAIDRFVPVSHDMYDSIERMMAELGW